MRDEKVGCVYKPHLTVFLWSSSQLPLCFAQGLRICFTEIPSKLPGPKRQLLEHMNIQLLPSLRESIKPILFQCHLTHLFNPPLPDIQIQYFRLAYPIPFFNISLVPCKL